MGAGQKTTRPFMKTINVDSKLPISSNGFSSRITRFACIPGEMELNRSSTPSHCGWKNIPEDRKNTILLRAVKPVVFECQQKVICLYLVYFFFFSIKGIYSIIRHPQFLAMPLISISLMFISQHWIVLLLGIPAVLLSYISTIGTDKYCIEKFGDEYKEYMT